MSGITYPFPMRAGAKRLLRLHLAFVTMAACIAVAAAHGFFVSSANASGHCTLYVGSGGCSGATFAYISGGLSYSTPSQAIREDNSLEFEDNQDWIIWYAENGNVWDSGYGSYGTIGSSQGQYTHSDCASSFDDTYAICWTDW